MLESKAMLEIRDLHAQVEEGAKEILRGVNLTIGSGEVHAIMGVNGSGKSTLANVLAGHKGYKVTKGEVLFEGKDLLDLEAEERATEGMFLAFQYPVELPGVNMSYFMRTALNAIRKHRGVEPIGVRDFATLLKDRGAKLGLNDSFLSRAVNEGFSGGEKKRNEILQMAVLEPKLAILDETDSGLDIDALQIVADGVNRLRGADRSFLIITHYQRLLNFIVPDVVHVMIDGRIVRTGGKELALELEEKGYGWVRESLKDSAASSEASI
jgi:Fe-S cluster assembly ATP-binding protein